jgi:hypothetical protein
VKGSRLVHQFATLVLLLLFTMIGVGLVAALCRHWFEALVLAGMSALGGAWYDRAMSKYMAQRVEDLDDGND